ncbi:MAG: glycosyltransferase family 2 protein, partial [Pseudomonadota bacterium]
MNSGSQPLVSILTPVYNGEKYLGECIESVLAQTHQIWEYVIVDNCSSDRTLQIAQKYSHLDSRIRLHKNTEFLEVIQNWNRAIRQISPDSKYCKIVHADDWLFPECIERMVSNAEENPSVGLVGSYVLRNNRVGCDGLPYSSTVISGREICRSALRKEVLPFGSPTSTLIRSNIIQEWQTFYNEAYLHADRELCFRV